MPLCAFRDLDLNQADTFSALYFSVTARIEKPGDVKA
jgi:hypothetical protein